MSNTTRTTIPQQFSIFLQPKTSYLVVSYTVSSIAVLLNGIEIKLILSKFKKATDFEILLLNLAIADVFNSLLFIGVTGVTHHSASIDEKRYVVLLYWLLGTMSFSLTASVSFVAAIGIERFFAIKLPLEHRLWHTSRKKLVRYILLTWLFNVIVIVAVSIGDYLREHNTVSATVSYFVASIFTIGCVLVLVVYTWVLHLMILRSLKLFDFDQKALQINCKKIKEAMKKEKSSIVICILVVVSFMVCNIPMVVDLFQLQLTITSAIFLKFSAVDNPLIYSFKGYLEKCYARKRLLALSHVTNVSKDGENATQRSKVMEVTGNHSAMIGIENDSLCKD